MWKTKKFPITLLQSRNLYYSYTHEIELVLIDRVSVVPLRNIDIKLPRRSIVTQICSQESNVTTWFV